MEKKKQINRRKRVKNRAKIRKKIVGKIPRNEGKRQKIAKMRKILTQKRKKNMNKKWQKLY